MRVDVVVPLLLVLLFAYVVRGAARDRVSIVSDTSRPYFWLLIVFWLVLAGDAALGENRPPFERAWKGAIAALLATSFGIDLWRRRRSARKAPPPAQPSDD